MPKSIFKIDLLSKLPLYHQIETNLRDLISQGELVTGQMVPSEWELAKIYGVSRLTVRRALDELVRQNWLSRKHGVGTFVKQPFRATIAASKLSFTEQMKAIGRKPSSLPLGNEVIPAPPNISQTLKISEGDPLIKISRLRLADEIPILHEVVYLPINRFPGLEKHEWAPDDSLYQLLREKYEVSVTGLDHTIKPTLLTREQAKCFGVKPGQPALISEIVSYSAEGNPVEYSLSVSNGDKGEFYFRFRHVETERET
jgi:GntR family transcriptional regulator